MGHVTGNYGEHSPTQNDQLITDRELDLSAMDDGQLLLGVGVYREDAPWRIRIPHKTEGLAPDALPGDSIEHFVCTYISPGIAPRFRHNSPLIQMIARHDTGSSEPLTQPPSPNRPVLLVDVELLGPHYHTEVGPSNFARQEWVMHEHETTVLIVDDSASVRKLVELTLRRSGFSVISAVSGLEALATLAETQPDLILLDVMLVSLDGFQLCRVIRNHPDYKDTPVVILSGRESEADRQTGFDAGVDAYLVKPFKPNELTTVVNRLIGADTKAHLV